jgi:hypothetical protein
MRRRVRRPCGYREHAGDEGDGEAHAKAVCRYAATDCVSDRREPTFRLCRRLCIFRHFFGTMFLEVWIFLKLGFLVIIEFNMYKSDQNSKLSSVDNVPSHHSGAQGRELPVASGAGRLLKLGGCAPDCGLARPSPALQWGAVNWRIMLASLIGWHCATASGPWRCASGPPVSAGPGSGVRPPPSHRGWSSSSASSVCLHCAL